MPVTPRALLGGAAACAVLFLLLLGLAYGSDTALRIDANAVQGLAGSADGYLEAFAVRFVQLCNPFPVAVMGVALALIALARARPRTAAAVLFLVGATSVSSQLLKALLAYPRYDFGYVVMPEAFPSGHATAAMTLSLCAVLVVPGRLRPLAAFVGMGFTLTMAFSLLFTQSHFPSDLVGGFLLASGWTLLVAAGLLAAERRWPSRAATSRVARLGRAVVDRVAAVSLGVAALGGTLLVALVGGFVVLNRWDDLVGFAEENTAAVVVAPLVVLAATALLVAVTAVLRRGA